MKAGFNLFAKYILSPFIDLFVQKVEGKENIPQGGFIVASNHIDGWDHWFVGNLFVNRIEEIYFLGAMEKLKIVLLFGSIYWAADAIKINRKKQDREEILQKVGKYLKKNNIVIIYPEGDINRGNKPGRGKTGVADLALRTNSLVLPVGMRRKKKGLLKKRIIHIGNPIDLYSQLKDNSQKQKMFSQISVSLQTPRKEYSKEYIRLTREGTDLVMEKISGLCEKE